MKRTLVLLLIFFGIAIGNLNSTCPNNCGGSDSGRCKEDGTCSCLLLRSGVDCSELWADNKTWNKVFLAYSIFVIVAHFACALFACHQLYIIFSAPRKSWVKGGLITQILILGLTGSILRILNFSIDPHAIRGILKPAVIDEIMFGIPLILWLGGGFMLFLYWVEVQQLSGMKELKSVTKLRPFLISLIILTALVILPAGIVKWIFGESLIATSVYNFFFVIAFIILIVVSLVYGVRLIRVFKNLYKSTKITRFNDFLTRLTKYLFALDFTLALTIVSLILYVVIGAGNEKWIYVAMHTILRIEEVAVLIFTYLLLSKKKPPESPDSTKNDSSKPITDNSTEMEAKKTVTENNTSSSLAEITLANDSDKTINTSIA